MVKIYSRASWGARYRAGFGSRSVGALRVFKHHSVTAHLSAKATVEDEKHQMRILEQIGQSRFGGGISYTWIIFPSGRIYEGTGVARIGAHTAGYNTVGAAICYAGNYETNKPTQAQIDATVDLLAYGIGRWWTRSFKYTPHRSIKSTACPGNYAYDTMNTEKERALAGDTTDSGGSGSGSGGGDTGTTTTEKRVKVDGVWGAGTTKEIQKDLAAPYKDGDVSRQNEYWQALDPGLGSGWEWLTRSAALNGKGSQTVKLLWRLMKANGISGIGENDGLVGDSFFKGLQKLLKKKGKYDGLIDGRIDRPSKTVKALQRQINNGNLRKWAKAAGLRD